MSVQPDISPSQFVRDLVRKRTICLSNIENSEEESRNKTPKQNSPRKVEKNFKPPEDIMFEDADPKTDPEDEIIGDAEPVQAKQDKEHDDMPSTDSNDLDYVTE